MNRTLLICGTLFLLLLSCQSDVPTEQAAEEAKPPVEEDALYARLSGELISNPTTQPDKDKNAIINYALDNKLDVQATPSGLYYEIIEEGEGESPKMGDRARAHYKGTLLNGQKFDSSYDRHQPITFSIGQMVPGWNEGMMLMKPGGKARLFIPSHLGYGTKPFKDRSGKDIIPPNSVLIFEIELKDTAPK